MTPGVGSSGGPPYGGGGERENSAGAAARYGAGASGYGAPGTYAGAWGDKYDGGTGSWGPC